LAYKNIYRLPLVKQQKTSKPKSCNFVQKYLLMTLTLTDVVILGTGRVALHLCRAFHNAGINIIQVYGRSYEKACSIAQTVSAEAVSNPADIYPDAALYVLSVSDDAIEELSAAMPFTNGIVVHTSGFKSMNAISSKFARRGVFYPLQTFSMERSLEFDSIPIFIQASNDEDQMALQQLGQKLSNSVQAIDDQQRRSLHLAAVFVSNFSNAMYDIGAAIVKESSLEFEYLKPLIIETAKKGIAVGAEAAQTGPARRVDYGTISAHQEMLTNKSQLAAIYSELTDYIIKRHNKYSKMSNYKALLNKVNTFIFDYDGVMTDGVIVINNEGEPLRTANVKDGYALQLIRKLGYNIAVISGGNSPSMYKRFETLGISDVFLGVGNKLEVFENYLKSKNILPEHVIYMGDDIPDYYPMKACGVPVCPSDASEEIKRISVYISHYRGGHGCVRDIIEQVLKVQGKWMNDEAHHW
jgi:3-deoxy-D-manno-octulosonate 8-phosphate phosphatase (KDO 8-P phosphatase)